MAPVLIPVAIAALGGGAALAAGAAGVTLASVALSVGITALTAGASYLLSKNTVAPAAAQTIDPIAAPANSQRAIPVSQAIPPRRFAYGHIRTGGALFFQDNNNPDLYVGSLLSDGVIESIDQVFFGETAIPVDGSGDAITGYPYFGKFSFEWSAGEPDQAASAMLLAGIDTLTSDFRQLGVARGVVRLDWGTDATNHSALWGSSISPSFFGRFLKVYDPRDVAQDLGDPTTWLYSANPALCIAHALTNAWGIALSADHLDWDYIADAADVCDTPVTIAAGTFPTFTLGGIFQAGVDFGAQISDMMTACRGKLVYINGKYGLVADEAKTPVWTITDDDILELGEYSHATEGGKLFNAISARFFNADDSGKQNETETYELADAIADEGLREASLSLPFTPDTHSAQILAFRELMQLRDGRALTMRVHDAGAYLAPGETVTLATTYATFLNGVFEVMQVDLADEGVMLTLRGYNPDVYTDPFEYVI